jgi:hypothetical protein
MMDAVVQGIISGFAAGLGSGLANWLLIKRLEKIELKILEKNNDKRNTSDK